ncbi:MAG TPA: hypothetical protein VF538_12015 [Pyrinomonadaceae bacterium]
MYRSNSSDLWPVIFLMMASATPSMKSMVVAKCRRSWMRRSWTLARAQTLLNRLPKSQA